LKGDKPTITARLISKVMDLRPFGEASKSSEKAKNKPPANAAIAPPGKKTTEKSRYVFQETPLQLEPLKRIEADAKITVNHFLYDVVDLKDVVIDAAVHDGRMDAKFKCNSAIKGHAAGKLDLRTQGRQAIVDAVFSLSDVHLNLLKPEGISPSEVPPTSVSIELNTKGASPRELAAGTNGRVLLTQGSGKLSSTLLNNVSGDILAQLVSALNPFAKHEDFSNWDCTAISVHIVDGLAGIDGLLAQGKKVMIVGGGAIDLKTEKLDLEFNTKPRAGVGVSADMFVTPFVKLTGTLASPGIGLNKKGALLSTGAAVATGGLSVLVRGLYDRATAEGDHCEKSLEAAGSHIRYDF
jgi:AsmA protein